MAWRRIGDNHYLNQCLPDSLTHICGTRGWGGGWGVGSWGWGWGWGWGNPIVMTVVLQYIPRNLHTVFALLCFVVVIHWLIFPYPSGLLHWHCGNLTIAPVPAKQPTWIWINISCEFIMNDCITTKKQSTTKPCVYFLGYTVCLLRGNPPAIPSHRVGNGNALLTWTKFWLIIFSSQIRCHHSQIGRDLWRYARVKRGGFQGRAS